MTNKDIAIIRIEEAEVTIETVQANLARGVIDGVNLERALRYLIEAKELISDEQNGL